MKGFFYAGPVPDKTLCPRCTRPIGEKPARSQLRYEGKRVITVCQECATEEWVLVKDGRTPVSDERWPVRPPERVNVTLSDDFKVELGEDRETITMDGTIIGSDVAAIMERELAKGRTMDEVLNEIMKAGVEGLKAIYDED